MFTFQVTWVYRTLNVMTELKMLQQTKKVEKKKNKWKCLRPFNLKKINNAHFLLYIYPETALVLYLMSGGLCSLWPWTMKWKQIPAIYLNCLWHWGFVLFNVRWFSIMPKTVSIGEMQSSSLFPFACVFLTMS